MTNKQILIVVHLVIFSLFLQGKCLLAAGYLDEIKITIEMDNYVDIRASGWAANDIMNDSLISVELFLNEKLVARGKVQPFERPDVPLVTGRKDWLNSGWTLQMRSLEPIRNGKWRISATAHFASGEQTRLICIQNGWIKRGIIMRNLRVITCFVFLLAGVILCTILKSRKVFKMNEEFSGQGFKIIYHLNFLCALLGLFIMIFFSKLYVILNCANHTPFWDEWNMFEQFLQPYIEGHLHLSDFLAAHNEHRIAMTRLLTLGLLKLNGSWEPNIEMSINAFLHAGILTGLAALLICVLPSNGMRILAICAMSLIFIPPWGYENTLWGFQSQFYFNFLASIMSIWLCWRHPMLSHFWWLGILVIFIGFFTNAAGAFAPAALVALYIVLSLTKKRIFWKDWTGIAVMATMTIIGFLLVQHIPDHDALKADSISKFVHALGLQGAWPSTFSPWIAIVMQAPVFILLLRLWHKRAPFTHASWFVCGLGFLFWIQMAATAYSRNTDALATRYLDTLAISLSVQFCALLILTNKIFRFRRWNLYWLIFVFIWMSSGTIGWVKMGAILPKALADSHDLNTIRENNVRGYLASGDIAYLENAQDGQRSYWDHSKLKKMLDTSAFHQLMPRDLRQVGALSRECFLFRATNWLQVRSKFMFGFGLALLFFSCLHNLILNKLFLIKLQQQAKIYI